MKSADEMYFTEAIILQMFLNTVYRALMNLVKILCDKQTVEVVDT